MREKIKPWLDCGVTGLIIRQGAPFDHERINESMELYKMVAEEAGQGAAGVRRDKLSLATITDR